MLTDIDLSEYTNPHLYNLENALGEELAFFLDLVEETGGPVLDVACGTGLLAREIAAMDMDVVGIDLSKEMLDYARNHVGDLPINYHQADCRNFQLDQWFSLAVMTGHAFQNLLSDRDQAALFAQVRYHLLPGGLFAFETRNPDASPLVNGCSRTFYREIDSDAGRIICSMERRYDTGSDILDYRIWRECVETGRERMTGGKLRFSRDREIRELLVQAGFVIHAVYGDWQRRPVTDTSPELIYLCQRPYYNAG